MIQDTFNTGIVCIMIVCSILTLQSILSIMDGNRKGPAMIAGETAQFEEEQKATQVLRILAKSNL